MSNPKTEHTGSTALSRYRVILHNIDQWHDYSLVCVLQSQKRSFHSRVLGRKTTTASKSNNNSNSNTTPGIAAPAGSAERKADEEAYDVKRKTNSNNMKTLSGSFTAPAVLADFVVVSAKRKLRLEVQISAEPKHNMECRDVWVDAFNTLIQYSK